MFANFHYNPGSHGHKNNYEDSLDKLKRQYNIDYGLGPSYDDVPSSKLLSPISEKIQRKLGSFPWWGPTKLQRRNDLQRTQINEK